jgi:hypothetical protein
MKEHLCPVEKALINYEGECNWCGEREWVGLTKEEVLEFTRASWGVGVTASEFIRTIEAKLKDKNT